MGPVWPRTYDLLSAQDIPGSRVASATQEFHALHPLRTGKYLCLHGCHPAWLIKATLAFYLDLDPTVPSTCARRSTFGWSLPLPRPYLLASSRALIIIFGFPEEERARTDSDA